MLHFVFVCVSLVQILFVSMFVVTFVLGGGGVKKRLIVFFQGKGRLKRERNIVSIKSLFLPPLQTAEGSKALSTPKCTHDPEVESFIKVSN